MKKQAILSLAAVVGATTLLQVARTPTLEAKTHPVPDHVTQGSLIARDSQGKPQFECPLKHTGVKAEVSGFLARVNVTQEFVNESSDKIEAVYVFPLPHRSAVDSMTMHVGDRTIKAAIKRREEAQAIYEAARNSGRVAGLLDQERPNIFTQHVANILPKQTVRITISYVQILKYEAGTYEFVFPMVVGPRYIPGTPHGKLGGGWAHDTDRVPDASRITPHVARPGTRAGHDISVQVSVDAGVPLETIASISHEVTTERPAASRALVKLSNRDNLPNKDFVLKYDVSGKKIQDAILAHNGTRGGFFTLFLQPPDKLNVEDITAKELVFVLDTSGSMSGFPIEKAKETMRLALDSLNPRDTFNLITFAGDTHVLFPQPVPATRENLAAAQQFLASRHGSGGTEMMKAIRVALAPTSSQQHVRIVCFMTDGYVGNEAEIIAEIQRNSNARVFSFGIGSAVNRYLLDKMAEVGRGEVEYVSLKDDGSAAARRFHERVRNPLLTDITLEWNGLQVSDVHPQRIPDLFSAKPLVVTGRYHKAGRGVIRLRGRYAGSSITRELNVDLPASEPKHDVLAALWARTEIDSLQHAGTGDMRERITQLGLEYKLMTPYTSFVAVEESIVTEGGVPRRVEVPVELPEGVSYGGVFGKEEAMVKTAAGTRRQMFTPPFAGSASQSVTVNQNAPALLPHISERSSAPAVEPRMHDKAQKLHPSLTGQRAAALAKSGKLEVQVYLNDVSPQALDQLKKLGFEVSTWLTSKVAIGRVSLDKLETLSKLAIVNYVAPPTTK